MNALDVRLAAFGWRVQRTGEGWELTGNGSPALFGTEVALLDWLEHQERDRPAAQRPRRVTQLALWDVAA